MTPTDRYFIVEHRREPVPRIVLRRTEGGGGEPVVLDAACLLAQYAVSDTDTLIVLDEDTPYEEQLHLVLLRDDHVLDHIVIGAPYAGGAFRPVEPSADTLGFRFESERVWTLAIESAARWGIGGLPSGASRRTGLLAPRHIKLDQPSAAFSAGYEDRPESMDLTAET